MTLLSDQTHRFHKKTDDETEHARQPHSNTLAPTPGTLATTLSTIATP